MKPNCWPSRPGAQSATNAAAMATDAARTSSDRSIDSRNADSARSASRAPCGPMRSATARAWARESSAASRTCSGKPASARSECLVVLRGEYRTGDGDADRGADLPRRVVDRRCDALLLVGHRVHDRGSGWCNAQADAGAGDQERPHEVDVGRPGIEEAHGEQPHPDEEQAERDRPPEGRSWAGTDASSRRAP